MKRKIIALAVVVAMLAIAIIGGTLAYFTDTDSETNVLTMGNVKIEIHEDNDDPNSDTDVPVVDDEYRDWLEAQPFHPGVTLEKNVTVENTGENNAFVRVYTAWPLAADRLVSLDFEVDGWEAVASEKTKYDVQTKVIVDDLGAYYITYIDGVPYRVACHTLYVDEFKPGDVTKTNLSSIKLLEEVQCKVNADGSTTYFRFFDNDGELDVDSYTSENGQIPVLVHAQAVQTTTFANAFDAFNKAFGPYDQNWWTGTYTVDTSDVLIKTPIISMGTAIALDGQDQIHVYGTEVSGVQLAEITKPSGLYFTNVNSETDTGIFVSKDSTNTCLIFDDSDFIIKDGGFLVETEEGAGAVVIYINGRVTVNGVLLTRDNIDQYIDNNEAAQIWWSK